MLKVNIMEVLLLILPQCSHATAPGQSALYQLGLEYSAAVFRPLEQHQTGQEDTNCGRCNCEDTNLRVVKPTDLNV